MPKFNLYYRDFPGRKTYTGGVTGSARISDKFGQLYQLKPSILENSQKLRRLKAGDTDRENFGEMIAAAIARAAHPDPGLVPEVFLVQGRGRQVSVASKYLADTQGTLNDYMDENVSPLNGARFIKFVRGYPNIHTSGEVDIDKTTVLIRGTLAEALAISALVGDHDVNPGNMLVVGTGDHLKVARIDFGHAFNDLLNAPAWFGGKVNYSNQIIDFLNRETVAHAKPSHRKSKLWQSYPGMIPSRELAAALRTLSESGSEKVKQGIEDVKANFRALYKSTSDPALKKHIASSLLAIHRNLTGHEISGDLSDLAKMDVVFEGIQSFCEKNIRDMMIAAEIMEFQMQLDESIKKPSSFKVDTSKLKEMFADNPIPWIKADVDTPAFKGTIEEYVQYRKALLGETFQLQINFKESKARPAIASVGKTADGKVWVKLDKVDLGNVGGEEQRKIIIDKLARVALKEAGYQCWGEVEVTAVVKVRSVWQIFKSFLGFSTLDTASAKEISNAFKIDMSHGRKAEEDSADDRKDGGPLRPL